MREPLPEQRIPRRPHPRRVAPLLLAGAALSLSGCNIVGPAFFLVHGPEKTPAVHKLDETMSTVIFIDDRNNVVPRRALRYEIAATAEQGLLSQDAVEEIISSQAAMQVASAERFGEPKSIARIGREVTADAVVYAHVDQFTLSPDGQTYSPTAVLRVKIIRASDGERIWPQERDGYPLTVVAEAQTGLIPTSFSERMRAESQLAELTGQRLARLFYKHVDAGKPTVAP